MKNIELEDSDLEELDYLMVDIEKKFNIQFEDGELDIKDLNKLDTIVLDRIQKETDTLCTSQKVFYQLRYIFDNLNLYDADKLKTDTSLKDIIASKNRQKKVKQIDELLGIKSNILCPNPYLLGLAFIVFISSIIICFFSLTVGLATMVTAFLITYLSCKFRRSLNFDTIREFIQNITENNYLYIRKETNTVNKTEVKNIIRKWLSETIGYKMKGDEEISFSLKTK